jgi:hypothetical protein
VKLDSFIQVEYGAGVFIRLSRGWFQQQGAGHSQVYDQYFATAQAKEEIFATPV